MTTTGPILITYDGSENARHAIEHAGEVLRGGEAIVLYVREPLEGLAAHLEGHPALEEVRSIDVGRGTPPSGSPSRAPNTPAGQASTPPRASPTRSKRSPTPSSGSPTSSTQA